MKQLVFAITMFLCTTQVTVAQTKRHARSPFIHSSASTQRFGGERGNAPANDDCANAQAIAIAIDCASPIAGDNSEATNDGPDATCDDPGAGLLDVWYTFNSGAEDTVAISLVPSVQMTDWAFVVYDGCGGTEIACRITPATPVDLEVAPGTDYWIRVYSNPNYGDPGPFALCVSTPTATGPPPANDNCTDVVPQALGIGSTLSVTGTTLNAVDNDGVGYPMVWETFTLGSCADVKISFCGTAPKIQDFWLLLYTSCSVDAFVTAGSYDSTACVDGNFTLCYSNLAAGSYYYPIAATLGNPDAYTMNVSATDCGSDGPVNDDCEGAIPLTASATCEPTSFSDRCATESLPAVNCGGFTGNASDDVWYSFVATATEMTIGGAPLGSMDIALELFSGGCGSLTSIACGDVNGSGAPDDMIASDLTIGSTYFFRVYDFRTQFAYGDPTYELCIVEGPGSGLGLEEPNEVSPGTIYPNPTQGDFTIQVGHEAALIDIDVIDATGRTVIAQQRQASNGVVSMLDNGSLNPGLYVVHINDGATVRSERLIVR
jgi:hypothetical protein